LTDDKVAARQAGLADWRDESNDTVLEWAGMLGVDPPTLLANPHIGIEPVDAMLGHEDLSTLPDEDRNYVAAKLIAHVGALLVQQHGGGWAVDDDPSSPSYARYVIKGDDGKRYDPGRAVMGYFQAPSGRRIVEHIAEAEAAAT
jgi:hypothetical protein